MSSEPERAPSLKFGPIPVGDLRGEGTRQALALWEHKRGGDPVPLAADINPLDFPRLLPEVFLLEVEYGDGGDRPTDFIFRLIGERNIEAHGVNLTGHRLSDPEPFGKYYSETVTDFCRRICKEKAPIAAAGSMALVNKDFGDFEGIYLPFADEGGRVVRILAVAAYF